MIAKFLLIGEYVEICPSALIGGAECKGQSVNRYT